jgi:hypothetical protein
MSFYERIKAFGEKHILEVLHHLLIGQFSPIYWNDIPGFEKSNMISFVDAGRGSFERSRARKCSIRC